MGQAYKDLDFLFALRHLTACVGEACQRLREAKSPTGAPRKRQTIGDAKIWLHSLPMQISLAHDPLAMYFPG